MQVHVIITSNFDEYDVEMAGYSLPLGEQVVIDIQEYDELLAERVEHNGLNMTRWSIEVIGTEENAEETMVRNAEDSADALTAKLELYAIVLSEINIMLPEVSDDTKAIVASNIFLKL